MRSGFITSYKAVMGVGAKAKTVTNLLILLSVLGLGLILKLSRCNITVGVYDQLRFNVGFLSSYTKVL